LPVRTENTHPFAYGHYAFMHNGFISKVINSLIRQDLWPLLNGDTDSEKYFIVAMECMERLGPFNGMIEAVQKICNTCDYTSLNAMVLTPDELIVVSQYRPERIPTDEPDNYYEIRYKATRDQVVVASTGWPQDGWMPLPNRSISRIDRRTLMISSQLLSAP